MRRPPALLCLAHDTRGAAHGWLFGGLLALVGLGLSAPGISPEVERLAAAAADLASAPVVSLLAE